MFVFIFKGGFFLVEVHHGGDADDLYFCLFKCFSATTTTKMCLLLFFSAPFFFLPIVLQQIKG